MTAPHFSEAAVGASGVIGVAGGRRHSLFCTAAGEVWSCGARCEYGQAGETTGSQFQRLSSLVDVVAVACGYSHSLVLTRQGRVLSFGQDHGPMPHEVGEFPAGISCIG